MKLKQSVAILLTLLLLFCMAPVATVSAASPKLLLDMPQNVEPGKQIAVTVGIKNNPGWSALQYAVEYDANQLELLNAEWGEIMSQPYTSAMFNGDNPGKVIGIGLYNDSAPTVEESKNMEKDGTWMTLYFKVKDSVKNGDSVTVSLDMQVMANAKLETTMQPTVVKETAKAGPLKAADNKTEPKVTKAEKLEGVVGTLPDEVAGMLGVTTAAGDKTTAAGNKTDAAGNQTTAAGGQADKDEAPQTTQTNEQGEVITPEADGANNTWIWLVVAAVVAAGAGVLFAILRKRK